jgi:hypothetical protein
MINYLRRTTSGAAESSLGATRRTTSSASGNGLGTEKSQVLDRFTKAYARGAKYLLDRGV